MAASAMFSPSWPVDPETFADPFLCNFCAQALLAKDRLVSAGKTLQECIR